MSLPRNAPRPPFVVNTRAPQSLRRRVIISVPSVRSFQSFRRFTALRTAPKNAENKTSTRLCRTTTAIVRVQVFVCFVYSVSSDAFQTPDAFSPILREFLDLPARPIPASVHRIRSASGSGGSRRRTVPRENVSPTWNCGRRVGAARGPARSVAGFRVIAAAAWFSRRRRRRVRRHANRRNNLSEGDGGVVSQAIRFSRIPRTWFNRVLITTRVHYVSQIDFGEHFLHTVASGTTRSRVDGRKSRKLTARAFPENKRRCRKNRIWCRRERVNAVFYGFRNGTRVQCSKNFRPRRIPYTRRRKNRMDFVCPSVVFLEFSRKAKTPRCIFLWDTVLKL